jgi:hypothetical protein
VAGHGDLLEEDVFDAELVDALADVLDLLTAAGIAPRLLEGRERIGDSALGEDVLDESRARLDGCHWRSF